VPSFTGTRHSGQADTSWAMDEREKGLRRRAALCSALTVAAFATTCAGVQAKTLQVGPPLTGSFPPYAFGGPYQLSDPDDPYPPPSPPPPPNPDGTFTLWQRTLSEPGANAASPVDGTVISYRVAGADGTFAIQVVRTSGTHDQWYSQSIASSTPTQIASEGLSSPIATDLNVEAKDAVGIRNFAASDKIGWRVPPAGVNGLSSTFWGWSPALADGGPAVSNPFGGGGVGEIGMQATVRYCLVPSVRGKSAKGARKTLSRADCTVGKLKKSKSLDRKKTVHFQNVQPGLAVSDKRPINLKVR
jgi:hypothetical protein